MSSRDYSGVRESGPRKRDEDHDDDGDVDEEDHCAMIPLLMALRCHRERGGEVLPLVLTPPWHPPWIGRGSPSGPWPSW